MVHSNHAAAVRPRVLALLPDAKYIGGCTFVRITGPLAYLKAAGYPIDWIPMLTAKNLAKTKELRLTEYDLFVVPRVGDRGDGKVVQLFETLRAVGKAVIWETDDDYTNEHRVVLEGDASSVMSVATALTVSTPHLREQCRKHTDKPIYLLQNCIDFQFWDMVPKKRILQDTLTVGLVGTTTHYNDWILARDALYRIAADYPDVHFVLGGYCPDYLEDLPRTLTLPPTPYQNYPNMVHQIDIGLCPLDPDDEFNKSKSAIKAMEYWAAGAAVVASDCSVYRRTVDEDRGFFATTTEEWYTAIANLIEDPELRTQTAAAGRTWVEKNRNMRINSAFWWDVYALVHREYGGKIDVSLIDRRSVGLRPPDGKGRSGDHVLPLPGPARRRRSRHDNRTNAPGSRRRPASGRSA